MYIISRLGQLGHTTHTYTHISQDNGVEDKVFWRRKKGFQTARQTKKSSGLCSASKYKLSCKAHACVLFLSYNHHRWKGIKLYQTSYWQPGLLTTLKWKLIIHMPMQTRDLYMIQSVTIRIKQHCLPAAKLAEVWKTNRGRTHCKMLRKYCIFGVPYAF